jgi:L-threonylcarbamoyladenylate synthase
VLTLQIDRESPAATVLDVVTEGARILRCGGIVAYPTDTLYGLAVDPRNDEAVSRLYAAKGRDAGVPVPLIGASVAQIEAAAVLTETDRRLARAFWPGPLTIVVAARTGLSPRIPAADGTIAVRVPANTVAVGLAAELGSCITATSANRSGQPAAVTGADVRAAFDDTVDLLIDGGPAAGGFASTIVAVGPHGLRLVRAGAVPWERVLRSLE